MAAAPSANFVFRKQKSHQYSVSSIPRTHSGYAFHFQIFCSFGSIKNKFELFDRSTLHIHNFSTADKEKLMMVIKRSATMVASPRGSSMIIVVLFFGIFAWTILIVQKFITERSDALRKMKSIQYDLHQAHVHENRRSQSWKIPFSSGTLGSEESTRKTKMPAVDHPVYLDFGSD